MFESILCSVIFVISLLTLGNFQRVTSPPTPPHWDYEREGPDAWHHLYDQCEGESQSPINIRTPFVRYESFAPLSLNGYHNNISSISWNFTHNGHTIVATPIQSNRLSISGGGLTDIFYLIQFHLHWGYNEYQGSEHTINNEKFPLEMHFVHRSSSTGQLAVIAILFTLKREDNPYLNDLLSVLNRTVNSSTTIEQQVDLSRLFPTSSSPQFYRYNGSLTTPPCTEGVIWTIFERFVPISSYQVRALHRNTIRVNYRSPQPLHSRKVVANFHPKRLEGVEEEEEGGGGHHSLASSKQISLILLFIISFVSIFSSMR